MNNKHSLWWCLQPVSSLERIKSKNAEADHSLFSFFSLLLHSKNQLIVSNLAKLCSLQNRRMHYHFSFRSLLVRSSAFKMSWEAYLGRNRREQTLQKERRRLLLLLFKLVSLLQRSKTNQGHHGLKGRAGLEL